MPELLCRRIFNRAALGQVDELKLDWARQICGFWARQLVVAH